MNDKTEWLRKYCNSIDIITIVNLWRFQIILSKTVHSKLFTAVFIATATSPVRIHLFAVGSSFINTRLKFYQQIISISKHNPSDTVCYSIFTIDSVERKSETTSTTFCQCRIWNCVKLSNHNHRPRAIKWNWFQLLRLLQLLLLLFY